MTHNNHANQEGVVASNRSKSNTDSSTDNNTATATTTGATGTTIYNNNNNKLNDLSVKFDFLAKKVLHTSGLLAVLPKDWFDQTKNHVDLCHVKALERVLDIKDDDENDNGDGDNNGSDNDNGNDMKSGDGNNNGYNRNSNGLLLTCTDFKSSSFTSSTNNNNNNNNTSNSHANNNKNGDNDNQFYDANPPQYWSFPHTDDNNYNIENENENEKVAHNATNTNDNYMNEHNITHGNIPLLEDVTPFTRKFYISVGQLLAFIYSQSMNIITNANICASENANASGDGNGNGNSRFGDHYSLPYHVDTVRVTRILSALMELNVIGNGSVNGNVTSGNSNGHSDHHHYNIHRKRKLPDNNVNGYNNNQGGEQEEKSNPKDKGINVSSSSSISFLDLLLYHTEQNTLLQNEIEQYYHTHHDIILDGHNNTSNTTTSDNTNQTTSIPFIQSLFKYYSYMPQLESHMHRIIRIYRSTNATNITDNTNNTKNNIDAKIIHMQSTQQLQEKLEKEFISHISILEHMIGMVYYKCDVSLRKKIRIRIGHLLHSFVLQCSSSSSNNNSMASTGGGGGGGLGVENTIAAGIDSMLKIVLRIVKGITIEKQPLSDSNDDVNDHGNNVNSNNDDDIGVNSRIKLKDSHNHLLQHVLLPMHNPSGMVLWRDQKSIIGLYHQSLVQCIGCIVSLDTSLIGKVIQYILHPDVWPLEGGGNGNKKGSRVANTPKVVLLLHEIDTLIGLLRVPDDSTSLSEGKDKNKDGNDKDNVISDCSDFDTLSEAIVPLCLRLATCISSDNSRTSERALEFFKNKKFKYLVKLHASRVMSPLLRALCRIDSGMEIPWNPTVRKMTLLVLRQIQTYDEAQFKDSCVEILTKRQSDNLKGRGKKDDKHNEKVSGSARIQHHDESPTADMVSLRKSMGSWKPPAKSNNAPSSLMPPPKNQTKSTSMRQNPPLTVTGIAPWKVKSLSQQSKGGQPPSTITGVAPWSIRPVQQKSSSMHRSPTSSSRLPNARVLRKPRNIMPPSSGNDCDTNLPEKKKIVDHGVQAVMQIRSYIDKLKPSGSEEDEGGTDGISNWAKTQMSESPLLLPSLKFHDLVFGQVLGTGSFSTVKYARQIIKGKTRSYWPEFAIKIVSTQKIEELGYENSVNREIAILRMLSHPGIARLVSSFRFRDGAYLVLEYASGGDLHTLLRANGSLDEESTRFVVGALVAALNSIHEMGLVFVDLKPENILITESGHVKITDFGGCRALTDKAKRMVKQTGQDLVKNLRDGDWHAIDCITDIDADVAEKKSKTEDNDVNFEDDLRIEGTTAYLPPEIILGGYPTFGTDSWALGCVFYQCLAGRPPLLEDNESSTRQRIVSFEIGNNDSPSLSSSDDDFFSVGGENAFSDDAKDLIQQLLSRNPIDRPNMITISEHAFFNKTDVFTLYKESSCRLDAGQIAPQPNSEWTRRQFSSIWAPQPQAYAMTNKHDDLRNIEKNTSGPIAEGDEAEGFFFANTSGKRVRLVGIREQAEIV